MALVEGSQGVVPQESASVVLARHPFDVYLTLRPRHLGFAGGYHVFPGGVLDEADADPVPAAGRIPGGRGVESRFGVAAIREVFEEVGLLLAYDAAGRPLWGAEAAGEPAVAAALQEAREQLQAGGKPLAPLLRAYGWQLAFDRLRYLGRWITPPTLPRRYDTRFFLADVSGCIPPDPYVAEVESGLWLPVHRFVEGPVPGLALMRPTTTILQCLALHRDVARAMAFYTDGTLPRPVVAPGAFPEPLDVVLTSLGVVRVPVPSPTFDHEQRVNVYIVASRGEAIVVDTGDGGGEGARLVAEAWERLGRPRVAGLLFTHGHPDHCRGAVQLIPRLSPGKIWAHPREREMVESYAAPFQVTDLLHGGEELQVGGLRFRVLHTPGHAPGHLAPWFWEHGVLLAGDLLTQRGSVWVGPPDGNLKDYLRTLRQVGELPVHIAAPGHGPPVTGVRDLVEGIARRRLRREGEIMALLQERPRSADDLLDALYAGKVPPGVLEVARRTILGHLEKLAEEGRVAGPDGRQRYSITGQGITG